MTVKAAILAGWYSNAGIAASLSEGASMRTDAQLTAGRTFFVRLSTVAVLATMVAIAADPKPALPETVALVVVDVAAVAHGYRASKLTGSNVINDKNEKIGTIDDIIIGRDRVIFAVLEVGGFLHIGGRLVAVPFQSLVIDDTGRRVALPGASVDELKKLPEFKYES
jgi:hypothetical protein